MRQSHRIPLVLAGLALSVAACAGSTSTPSATPTSAPSAPPTSTPTAPPTPTAAVAIPTTSSDAADAYPMLAGFQGHFTGPWTNTTFASTGSMTWDITPNPSDRTVKIVVAVGGNFFGGAGAPPESILLTHLAQGAISGHSAAFGDVSGTINPDGALHIVLTNIPGGVISKVEIIGAFTGGNAIAMDYKVAFAAGGNAAGTVRLNRT